MAEREESMSVAIRSMLRVPQLLLPAKLPSPEARKSSGDVKHTYEPFIWECSYEDRRYLELVSDAELVTRYKEILRNMKALVSRCRDAIPIKSFQGSWYWFKKEHQTRLEAEMRGLQLPGVPAVDYVFENYSTEWKPKYPGCDDVLFRYGEREHLERLVSNGQMMIRAAAGYESMDGDIARRDEELAKHSYTSGRHLRITSEDGQKIKILGHLKRTSSLPNYFMFCVAGEWDNDLFSDFNADACAVIRNSKEFARRVEIASGRSLPEWFFTWIPVEYFDPFDLNIGAHLDAGMNKDFRFAYQREFRFLWVPPSGKIADGVKFLEIGKLEDILELCVGE